MSVMNRALFRKELQLGLNTLFGLEYKRYPEEWRQIFDVNNSVKAYEEDVLLYGVGGAVVKEEGAGVAYDAGGEGWVARYFNETIALAFALTEEAIEDNLYGDIGAKLSKSMARGFQHTKEIKGVSILNNGLDGTNFPIGDGQALFSTAHPLQGGGTSSNLLPVHADLAEASLEDALNLTGAMVDDRGIPIAPSAMRLIVPLQLQFVAGRLTMSQLQAETANNAINASKAMGMLPGGVAVNHRLTDPTKWFIKTDVQDGLKHFIRKAISGGVEGDFDTGNLRYKKRERYSFGVSDWRGMVASG